jgi:uncharacterized phage-associated protein
MSYTTAMLIDHDREKLIEAVKYFALHTKKLGKTKLFKLLYFLDFSHYRDTGRSVTGLNYSAWKMGPVPVAFFEELKTPEADWRGQVRFELQPVQNGEMLTVQALSDFDGKYFSKREKNLLKALSVGFRDATADQMVEATHLENLPWHQIYEVQGRKLAAIPYTMALKAEDSELMTESIRDREEIISALRG